ncbi:MAG: transposase [Candidatus Sphingomonas phytovorans]|nr:transposase [Sphingomonas sp.]WEJ98468.1 MAG: transposase [Sphingomonas sp.]
MWTQQSRGRMAQIAKKTKRYPNDLTDEEWDRMSPLMPMPSRRGRPREVDFREVINAVRYLVRSGCGWRIPMAPPGSRLRKTHRRLSDHDPRRDGRKSSAEKRSHLIFQTDS